MKDLKTLLRYDKLMKEGHEAISPTDLLRHLPKVEPFAVGSVFVPYEAGTDRWEGHYRLVKGLTFQGLPEWNWCDLYGQVAGWLEPYDMTGYNKKTRNKYKNQHMERIKRELADYEQRNGLTRGTLSGGGGAGAALRAAPAGGGAAGSAGVAMDCDEPELLGVPPPPATLADREVTIPPPPPTHPPPAGA